MSSTAAARRALPSVDRLLNDTRVAGLIAQYGRPLVTDTVRALLDGERAQLGVTDAPGAFDEARFVERCARELAHATERSLRPVFNMTGTVLHTNLGRAVMPRVAADAVMHAMTQPVNLEYELDNGSRGERDTHVERWLIRLTGAEAAVVVNNNAAAVYLALNTLAARKEVPVSRGELVEIGGSFRIPDIMARSGCKLVEIGTTNRTHFADYANAIGPRTGAVMKVHTSNYAINGFTASVAEAELAQLARERKVPFIVDLGSGTLVDLGEYGLPHEPTPREALAQGADVVTFSGDKLLGGPQAGLIVGSKAVIGRIRKNPMKRALRVDKMTLAALEAVLKLYSNPARLKEELPTLRWLTRSKPEIAAQAMRLVPHVQKALADRALARTVDCSSQIGSGALPVDSLPSAGIAVEAKGRGSQLQKIAAAFRALPTPVIGRISENVFVVDLRCLDDDAAFVAQLDKLELPA